MTEKRYFEKRWEEEYYIFDSNTISESDFEKKLEYQDYRAFEDSMMGDEVVNRLNELSEENEQLKIFLKAVNEELDLVNRDYDTLEEEYDELKSTIAKLIEQNRKNNDLLLSDIRILEKALWCGGCENDYGRLKELRKEFMK